MAHRPRQTSEASDESEQDEGPKLEPVGTVQRELISPAGHKVLVDVPVYPPFRLEGRPEKKSPERRRRKSEPPAGSEPSAEDSSA